MRELDFNIEACLERWADWYHFEGDADPASSCKTYELDDPLYIKIMKRGYVDIDLTSPLSDYSCFNGRTETSPLLYTAIDGQDAPK